ncbi:unnamed protein product, partial [Dovyalis caffra]
MKESDSRVTAMTLKRERKSLRLTLKKEESIVKATINLIKVWIIYAYDQLSHGMTFIKSQRSGLIHTSMTTDFPILRDYGV